MDIVIIANFCMDFSQKDNGRFKYLADILCEENDVEIITSSFYHITKKHRCELIEEKYKVTLIEEPGYKKNVCFGRFFSHYLWGKNVKKYISKRKKPDVIYCAIPSLTAPSKVSKYCKKNSIPFIIDVQDLWPEAFQMVFNIPILKNVVFFPFVAVANGVYSRADGVCAVSQTYIERVRKNNRISKSWNNVYLGTDLSIFDKNASSKPILMRPKDEIWVGYCGTLGRSYDIKCVIDAIEILNNKKVKLLIMGDGPQEEEFKNYAEKKDINVTFLGRINYKVMCAELLECNMTVNPIVGKSVATIINKHADYAACGLPVLNTQNSQEYIDLINLYNMGFSSAPGDAEKLAENIRRLVDDSELREMMGKNARKCAEERFDRSFTYTALINTIIGEN